MMISDASYLHKTSPLYMVSPDAATAAVTTDHSGQCRRGGGAQEFRGWVVVNKSRTVICFALKYQLPCTCSFYHAGWRRSTKQVFKQHSCAALRSS